MHRLALIIALLASLGTAYANDTLYAVVEYGSAGNPLIPIDSTSEATLNGTLLAWQKCSRIRALDIQFRPLDLRLEEVEEPEALLGQVLLHFGALNVKTRAYPWLVWCGVDAPQSVRARAATHAEVDLAKLRKEARLTARRVIHLSPERSKEVWALGPTTARVVEEQMLVSNTTIRFKSGDNRGYVFQVVDLKQQRMLWQAFGHPEWSPGVEGIREVSAKMFFRLPKSTEVLMLGNSGSGWESTAFAIYKLRDGSVFALSP